MADEENEAQPPEEPAKAELGQPTPKKSDARRKAPKKEPEAKPTAPAKGKKPAAEGAEEKPAPKAKLPKAPRRPTLDAEVGRLLRVRTVRDHEKPRFTRTASYRYWRIGRWNSWRKADGIQSKQRRHYGYRSTIPSIGFGSPARVRGLTPSGFRPVIVRTAGDVEALNTEKDAALIARTVGTRRRLALEEIARKRGLHVLNPLPGAQEEE